MPRKIMLMMASALLVAGMAFAACDDDDDEDVIEDAGTEVSDIIDEGRTEVSDLTDDDETPGAGGGEQQRTQERERDCPTFEPGETPEPDATIPAGCPTPDTDDEDGE